jgi:hypothetical protein
MPGKGMGLIFCRSFDRHGDDQETEGETAEEDDENPFCQILTHSNRTLSERGIRFKLQVVHQEGGTESGSLANVPFCRTVISTPQWL